MKSVNTIVDDLWYLFDSDENTARQRALSQWEQAVGKKLAKLCHLKGYSDSVLIVIAFNPATAMELRYRSKEILATLNNTAGSQLFRNLRVKVSLEKSK